MTFRRHETEEEKKDRRERYSLLRAVGIEPKRACKFRDWTDNKIQRIVAGEANPYPILKKNETRRTQKNKCKKKKRTERKIKTTI